MEKKDWKRLRFEPRPDEWFVCNHPVEHKGDYSTWKEDTLIENGCGGFGGWTLEGSSDGNPVHDGCETCGYDEFDIYLGDEKVNEWTYAQLKERLALDPE